MDSALEGVCFEQMGMVLSAKMVLSVSFYSIASYSEVAGWGSASVHFGGGSVLCFHGRLEVNCDLQKQVGVRFLYEWLLATAA